MFGKDAEQPMDQDPDKQALEELLQFARGGMANDLKGRIGGGDPTAPGVGGDPTDPGADAPIPGVEPDEDALDGGADDASEGDAGGGQELSPEILKALLLKLKGSTGGV